MRLSPCPEAEGGGGVGRLRRHPIASARGGRGAASGACRAPAWRCRTHLAAIVVLPLPAGHGGCLEVKVEVVDGPRVAGSAIVVVMAMAACGLCEAALVVTATFGKSQQILLASHTLRLGKNQLETTVS